MKLIPEQEEGINRHRSVINSLKRESLSNVKQVGRIALNHKNIHSFTVMANGVLT